MSGSGLSLTWRYSGWILAITAFAVLAFQPRFMKFGTIGEAGFPLIYATWAGDELSSFSFLALAVDAIFPLLCATLLLRSFLRRREAIVQARQ